jgi:eukaryotic-like serine/threonine-protein kinase
MAKAHLTRAAVAVVVSLGLYAQCAHAAQGSASKKGKVAIQSTAARGATPASKEMERLGNLRWRIDTGEEAEGAPVVVDGVLYQGLQTMLVALDGATGKEKWRFSTTAPVCGTPVVTDGKIFFTTNDYGASDTGQCQSYAYYALDAATGKQLWSRTADIDPPTGGLAVADGVVYVESGLLGSRAFNALDAQTGRKKWQFKPNDFPGIGITVADGIVYFDDTNKVLYALDAESGLRKWTKEGLGCTPAVLGDTLFVAKDEDLCAVGADDAKIKWSFAAGSPVTTVPTVSDGVLYFASKKGILFAVSAADGTEKWRADIGPEAGQAVVVGDTVYCNSNGHWTAYALDIKTGKQKWFFNTGDYMPNDIAVANGTVYFTSGNYLYAIDAK